MKNQNQKWLGSDARWISMKGADSAENLYLQFRRSFEVDVNADISIDITAVSRFELYVNAQFVARGPAVSFRKYYYYHNFIVPRELLNKGKNVIGVLLHHDGANTKTIQAFEYGLPGLLLSSNAGLVSDEFWKVRRAPSHSQKPGFDGISDPLISKWGGYKDFYYGDKEDGWLGSLYDDSNWSDASEVAEPLDKKYAENLVKYDLPELESIKKHPVRIVDVANNLGYVDINTNDLPANYNNIKINISRGQAACMPSVTFDFGSMVVGYPKILLSGGFCIYELWYGETLDMYRLDVIRNPENGLWNAFQRRAFRFLKINFIALEQNITIENVSIENTWYNYTKGNKVNCNDDEINSVIEISKRTLKLNTSYHYEDCPHREQALWIFDMRAMALINYYYYGDAGLVAKNLRQCFATQYDDGSVNSTGPKRNNCFHLDFCMHLVSAVREYYGYTGDDALVKELKDNIYKLDEFIRNFKDDDGLLDSGEPGKYGSPFLDWSPDIDKLGKSVILNAIYAEYIRNYATLRAVAGDANDEYESEIMQHRQAVNDLLFDKNEGLYRDSCYQGELSDNISMQGNMAAVYAGFANEEISAQIINKIIARNYPPPFAPSFYHIIFGALAAAGRHDEILRQIKYYWVPMINRGAKTWWEVFDPATPEWVYPHPYLGNVPTYEWESIPVSTCHGWSGTCAYAIPRYLLGINLLKMPQGIIEIDSTVPALFDNFEYKIPLQGGFLHLIFKKHGSFYRIDKLQEPQGVKVNIK